MVTFTCNYCGDSVSKPKADKHVTIECKRKRYGFASLCCVDCLQDFDFRSYQSHTKCMTEEQRYSAPGFVPKASSGKGEKKQTSWVDTISMLLEKPTLTKLQRSVLQSISGYDNIPRKKSKFLNFMYSSAGFRKTDVYSLEVVFNLIESEFKAATNKSVEYEKPSNNPQKPENTADKLPVQNGTDGSKVKEEKPGTSEFEKPENTSDDLPVENGIESPKVKKKKKRSRVDEESSTENAGLLEKSSNHVDGPESIANGLADPNLEEGFTDVKKRKKKKEKDIDVPKAEANAEDVEMNVQSTSNDTSFQNDLIEAKSRGKKKHKHRENILANEIAVEDGNSELVNSINTESTCPPTETYTNEENLDGKTKKKKKRKLHQVDAEDDVDSKRSRIETAENEISSKFSWSNVVKTLLEKSKDHEMSVKRMTKKVVAEYQSFYSNDESFEDIAKKFNKKVKKLPFVIVSKDRIQLYVE